MAQVPSMKDITKASYLGFSKGTNPMNKNLNVTQHFVLVGNCYPKERCAHWIAPTLKHIGCGINAIRFMGEIDDYNGQSALNQAINSGFGTPFQHMVYWFNDKIKHRNNMTISEFTFDITTKLRLQGFFNVMIQNIQNNSCVLVKYNRHPSVNVGHYVLLSKENDILITYEPLTSSSEKCDSKHLNNNKVSDSFFNAMTSGDDGYISASVMVVNIDSQQLPKSFRKIQPSDDDLNKRAWKYIPNTNPNPLGAEEHLYWVNSRTNVEQVNAPDDLTPEEIKDLKLQHENIYTDANSDSNSDANSDENSDANSPLVKITRAVKINKTKDNRTGPSCDFDCVIRSMKGMGWLRDEDIPKLVKSAKDARQLTEVALNTFLNQNNYMYNVISIDIDPKYKHIYDYVKKTMVNDTCSMFNINVDPEMREATNNEIYLKMNNLKKEFDEGKMSKKEYIKQYEILDNKLIKHASHVVIICKDRDGEITLWDTQRLNDSGFEKYFKNVGKESINEYIQAMGLGLDIKNFKLIGIEQNVERMLANLTINTSSPTTNGKTKKKIKNKTKRKTKRKQKGKNEDKTKKQREEKTKKQREEKTKKQREEKTKKHREDREEKTKKQRKQSRAEKLTRKRKKSK